MTNTSLKLTRRNFLAITAAAAMAGCSRNDGDTYNFNHSGSGTGEGTFVEEKIMGAPCRSNCQSNCRIMMHVRNGRLVRTSRGIWVPENNTEMGPDGQMRDPLSEEVLDEAYRSYERICLRGLSQVQRLYSPTRILKPLLQTGERGDVSTFQQISWEEALELYASKLAENYDPNDPEVLGKKICYMAGSGNYGLVQGLSGVGPQLFDIMNSTKSWVGYDMSVCVGLSKVMGPATFPFITGNEMRDVKNAKTLFLWGSNMAEAQMIGWQFVREARENGNTQNVVSIDVMANTTAAKSDYLYRIKPGSDTMLALAMINEIINNRWKTDLSGMPPEVKEYILHNTNAPYLVKSNGDGTYSYLRNGETGGAGAASQFVAWNATTGMPVTVDVEPNAMWFAGAAKRTELPDLPAGEEYALTGTYTVAGQEVKPVYQWLIEKTAEYTPKYAEAYTGVSEENLIQLVDLYLDGPTTVYMGFGTSHHYNSGNFGFALAVLGAITGNIGKKGASIGNFFSRCPTANLRDFKGVAPTRTRYPYYTMVGRLAEDLRNGDSDVKMLVCEYSNPISNSTDAKRNCIDTIYNKQYMDFIVTYDLELSESARYSDLILPVCHWFETEDVLNGSKYPFVSVQEKISEPMGESMSDADILRHLSLKLREKIPSITPQLDNLLLRPDGTFKTDWDLISERYPDNDPTNRVTATNLKAQKAVRAMPPDRVHISLLDVTVDVANDTVRATNPDFDPFIYPDKTQMVTSNYTGKLDLFCEDALYSIRMPLVYMDDKYFLSMYPNTGALTDEGKALTAKEQFPEWLPPADAWSGPLDGLPEEEKAAREADRNAYPLIYMQEHPRWRVHSQWTEVPWLRELDPEPLIKISPADAARYGNIQTGDMVKASNERGHAIFRAIVNPQMPEGIVNAPKGWQRWLYTQQYGDGGCYNDMTNPEIHPTGVDQIFWDARVKIEKIG